MTDTVPSENLSLISLIKEEAEVEVALVSGPTPVPSDDEVLVKVQAAPINPSDLILMLPFADLRKARSFKKDGQPAVVAPMLPYAMRSLAGRVNQQMGVGNEGSGVVVVAGASPQAQALLGKTVAMRGGDMFTQYRCLSTELCMIMPDGTDPRDAASCYVNPLTALGFVETMKQEGHSAIVHTAAASNLGLMLNRICIADGIPLVNIVRSTQQVELLKAQGAQYALNSNNQDFRSQLVAALEETGATIAFDAIGGGELGGRILEAMEAVAARKMPEFSRYGSLTLKQLYVYGGLDLSPIVLGRATGMQWAAGGWLLILFMAKTSPETLEKMRARIAAELTTTFASHYSHEITLEQALNLDIMIAYDAKRTGEKYLIRPCS